MILFYKDYIGAQRDVMAVIYKKKIPGRLFSTTDKRNSADVSSDTIFVENWFGRMVFCGAFLSRSTDSPKKNMITSF